MGNRLTDKQKGILFILVAVVGLLYLDGAITTNVIVSALISIGIVGILKLID